jgi:hypothetical protein
MNRNRRSTLAVALVMSLTLPGCSKSRSAPSPATAELPLGAQDKAAPPARQNEAAAPAGAAQGGGGPAGLAAMVAARKLIRTGQISMEVPAFEAAAQKLAHLAAEHAGYVAQTQVVRGQENKQRGTLTLRVPADRFELVLAGLRSLGKVESENVGTQDVTKEYTDLETRLRVKRDTAERIREILKTRTGSLSDVLTAERELARVTEEIEQAEGERRFYDQQVALSTLTVEMHEPDALVRAGALSPIAEALRDALGAGATSIAVMIYALVVITPWVFALWILWRVIRAVRRRSSEKRSA